MADDAILYEIPLSSTPQVLKVTLSGVDYQLNIKWCAPTGVWVMDLLDGNANLLVGSIPLVTGTDLLAQYGYLEIGGKLVVLTDGDALALPTFDNLGSSAHLFYAPNS